MAKKRTYKLLIPVFKKVRENIAKVNTVNKELVSDIIEDKKQLSSQRSKIVVIEEEKAQCQEKISQFQNQLNLYKDDISAATKEAIKKNEIIKKLSEQLDSYHRFDDAIKGVKTDNSFLSATIKEQSMIVESLKKQLIEKDLIITKLQKYIGASNENLLTKDKVILALNEEKKLLEKKTKGMLHYEKKVELLASSLNMIQFENADLKKKAYYLEENNNLLLKDKLLLEKDINPVQNELKTLRSEVLEKDSYCPALMYFESRSYQAEIKDLKNNLQDAQAQLKEKEDAISLLQDMDSKIENALNIFKKKK